MIQTAQDPYGKLMQRIQASTRSLFDLANLASPAGKKLLQSIAWDLDTIAQDVHDLKRDIRPFKQEERLNAYEHLLQQFGTLGASVHIKSIDSRLLCIDGSSPFSLPKREWDLLWILFDRPLPVHIQDIASALKLKHGKAAVQNIRNRLWALRKTLLSNKINPFYIQSNGSHVHSYLTRC